MKAYISVVFCLLLLSQFSQANADHLIEIEHLWLTQDIHVAGDRLCQDGQYMYFNTVEDCKAITANKLCSQNLKISPITFMEKVELPDGRAVSHFYNLPDSYEYSVYELVSEYPVINYELIGADKQNISLCKGMKMKPAQKVRRIRKAKKSEVAFLEGLIRSGVSIVNSPYGKFDPQWLFSGPSSFESQQRPQLKSPLCNEKLDYKDLVTQASGEWTGNGIIQVEALSHWHNQSLDLFINKTVDQNNKENYEFFCLNEVEDV